MYVSEIGTRVRQLRAQRNLSQVDLARLLGVSKSVVSAYENNVHQPPYDVLLRLARIFGVSTDYLLGAGGNRCISVDGLTDGQVEAVAKIVEELRRAQRQTPDG